MTREQATELLADALHEAQSSGHSGCQDTTDRFRPWARTLLAGAGAVFIDPALVAAIPAATHGGCNYYWCGRDGTCERCAALLTLADAVLADYAPPRPR